jgi:hypothetical protein
VCRSGFDAASGRCRSGQVEAPADTLLALKCAACTPSNQGVECTGDGLDNDCDGAIDDSGVPCG